MIKMIFKVLLIVPLATTIAWSRSDIDVVKSGVLEISKTLTVGQALDNWRGCENSTWESFTASNGVRVVEFVCHRKLAEHMQKFQKLISEINIKDVVNEQTLANGFLDIVASIYIIQFTVNVDDTFQVDNLQKRTVWADGTIYERPIQRPEVFLKGIYQNKPSFNLSALNADTLHRYIRQLVRFKSQSKPED